jgi:hypothetical protein
VGGLTEGQRVALATARDAFERERAELTARLLALVSDEGAGGATGGDAAALAAALEARVMAIGQVTSKRDAACVRAIQAVCDALTTAQRQQIELKCAATAQR